MDDITLILGDCLEEMKKMADKSVDLVVTSPPFSDEDVPKEYYEWLIEIIKEMQRLSQIILMFNSSKRLNEICKRFEPNRILIWDKKRTESAYRYEPIFCWANGLNLNKYIWNDCLAYIPVLGSNQLVPFENPLTLYKMLIHFFEKDISNVLDPFMGSGTTGVACKELNRKFIGIEINKDYYEIACKRIANTIKSMF